MSTNLPLFINFTQNIFTDILKEFMNDRILNFLKKQTAFICFVNEINEPYSLVTFLTLTANKI